MYYLQIIKYLVITLFFTIYLVINVDAQDIYVSKDGNDSNPGTIEKPVSTLEAARDLIRHYKTTNDLPVGGITVWIGEGQYDQEKPLILNENDSGEPDARIVWRAIPDENVSVTGGKSIPTSAFQKVTNRAILKRLSKTAAQNVLQVNLKEHGIKECGGFGHLFFNHSELHRRNRHCLPDWFGVGRSRR